MQNFQVLFLFEARHILKFSNLHWCTFKIEAHIVQNTRQNRNTVLLNELLMLF